MPRLELRSRIAERARNARVQAGLTQEALAERAGIQPRTISLIETAQITATLETLEALTLALGLELVELFGSEPTPATQEPGEKELLDAWRGLPVDARRHVLGLLAALRPSD